MRWLAIFAILEITLLGAAFATLWAYGGPEGTGLSTHGVIALVLGITGTAAVAVGLMGLVFESDSRDHDHRVHAAHEPTLPADVSGPGASRDKDRAGRGGSPPHRDGGISRRP